jgi:hypothetical protein
VWTWIYWAPTRKTAGRVLIEDSQVSVWGPGKAGCRGAQVSFLNPITHKWQVGKPDGWCWFDMNLAPLPTSFAMPLRTWVREDVETTFSKSAAAGTWGIAPWPVSGYGVFNTAGQGVWAILNGDFGQSHDTRVYA